MELEPSEQQNYKYVNTQKKIKRLENDIEMSKNNYFILKSFKIK